MEWTLFLESYNFLQSYTFNRLFEDFFYDSVKN
jgi:hypothetical protein